MDRVIAYIDGYNLYFGLRDKGWKRFYWINLAKLAEQFLKPNQTLLETKYYTTIVKYPESKRLRQQTYLDVLQTLPNFSFFLRAFSCRPNYLPPVWTYLHHASREDDRRKYFG